MPVCQLTNDDDVTGSWWGSRWWHHNNSRRVQRVDLGVSAAERAGAGGPPPRWQYFKDPSNVTAILAYTAIVVSMGFRVASAASLPARGTVDPEKK